MSNLSVSNILGHLRGALELAKLVSPLVGIGGTIVEKVITVMTSATDIVTDVKARVEEGKIVMSSTDQAELDRILSEIQAENDKLAAIIEGDDPTKPFEG